MQNRGNLMYIVLLGPPGAGKGTYSPMLTALFKIPVLSLGDILRNEAKCDTKLGRKIENYIKTGKLVPDNLIIEIVSNIIDSEEAEGGVIFDGFPRTINQAEKLLEILKQRGLVIDLVLDIFSKDKIITDRLSSRWVCPYCGRAYNMMTAPPKKNMRCDFDDTLLIQRDDDTPNVIKRRLKVYKEQSKPILDLYIAKSIPYIRVDSTGTIKKCWEKILNSLFERNFIDKKTYDSNKNTETDRIHKAGWENRR